MVSSAVDLKSSRLGLLLLRKRKEATGQRSDSAKVLNISTHCLNGYSGISDKGANQGIIKLALPGEGHVPEQEEEVRGQPARSTVKCEWSDRSERQMLNYLSMVVLIRGSYHHKTHFKRGG